jgi:hypothetical protein
MCVGVHTKTENLIGLWCRNLGSEIYTFIAIFPNESHTYTHSDAPAGNTRPATA